MPCGFNAVAPADTQQREGESHPDEWEGRRWLRMLAFFAINFCTVGLQFSFASLLVLFEPAFPSQSKTSLASVGAISLGVMDLSAVISGLLIVRFGERSTCACGGALAGIGLLLCSAVSDIWGLIATYGVLFGLGTSLALYSGILLLHGLFDARRGIASGIGSTGAGIGTMLWGIAIPYLEYQLGLQGLLRALGGFVLVGICSAAYLLNNPYPQSFRKSANEDELHAKLKDWQGLASVGMRLTCAGVLATACGLYAPIVKIVDFASHHGTNDPQSSMLVSYMGLGSVFFRLLLAWISDYIGRHSTVVALLYLYGATVIAAGSGTLVGLYPALVLYAIVWGGLSGSFFTVMPSMMADMVDDPCHTARATAFVSSLAGCGFIFGPMLLDSLSNDINQAIRFAGALILAGGILLHLARWAPRNKAEVQPGLMAGFSDRALLRLFRRRSSVLPLVTMDMRSAPINLDVSSVTSDDTPCKPSPCSSDFSLMSTPTCHYLTSSPHSSTPVSEQALSPICLELMDSPPHAVDEDSTNA